MPDEVAVGLLDVLVTFGLGVVGFFLVHNLGRQIKLKITDKRLEAYTALWEVMEIASPTRLREWHPGPAGGPLTQEERLGLYQVFVSWYYENGNGMLLGGGTRNLYLTVKDNFVCPDDQVEPEIVRQELQAIKTDQTLSEPERRHKRLDRRGRLSIRQLSILRTRMKADLEVYGRHYFGKLRDEDKALLEASGETLWRKPWGGIGSRGMRVIRE